MSCVLCALSAYIAVREEPHLHPAHRPVHFQTDVAYRIWTHNLFVEVSVFDFAVQN